MILQTDNFWQIVNSRIVNNLYKIFDWNKTWY